MTLRTKRIPIDKLVVHESAATAERTQRVPSDTKAPVLVKPLPGTDLYHVRDGANRTYNARAAGRKTVNCVVGTPDYSDRRRKIAELRMRASKTGRPVDALALVPGDEERKDLFYQEADAFGPRAQLSSARGTVVHALLTVSFGAQTQQHYLFPRKTLTGGIIIDPEAALTYFRPGAIDPARIAACWGDPKSYDPAVLPAWIELSDDGQDCFAGGFFIRRYYQKDPGPYPPLRRVEARGTLQGIQVVVVYPDGEIYQGPIAITRDTVMVLWNEQLVRALADPAIIDGYNPSRWWRRPTSLVFNGASVDDACFAIEHSCGCTCGNCD